MAPAQFLEVAGGRLAYEVSGPDGAPLVLCAPGMGDLRGAFRFLTPLLVDAGYRVAVSDLRGHGESSSGWAQYGSRLTGEDLLALIAQLGGPATVLGHSSSSAAAIWAAAEEPTNVTSIVLVGPFVRDAELNALMRVAVAIVTRSATAWARLFYPSLYKAGKPADFREYLRALQANLREPGRMAAVRGLLGSAAECVARIPELRCPVLIVMGSGDPDFPDAVAEARYAEQLIAPHTDVDVQIVEGAGHYPHAELPAATAAAVTTMLAALAHA